MGFWFALGALLFTTGLSYLLRPRVRLPRNVVRHSSASEFRRPTAEEGRPLAVVFGSGLIEGPNVVWNGDYAAEPIIEAGSTIGYKYFLGLQYGICAGPIDRVLDVRFDQKVLALGTATIPPGQVLKVNAVGVNLPAGEYANGGLAAAAVSDAIATSAGVPSRIVYGYQIVAGETSKLHFRLERGSSAWESTVELIPGAYSGVDYAAELNRAIAAVVGTAVNVGYDAVTERIAVARQAFDSAFTIFADSDVIATMGFVEGANVVAPAFPSVLYGVATHRFRFTLSPRPGDTFAWTDPATNCHAVFGMDPAAPDTTTPRRADFDRFAAAAGLSFAEFGAPDGTRATVSAPDLFGGIKDEGGIEGVIDIYHGTETQEPDSYLAGWFGTTPPAMRGIAYAVARKLYQGTSPYLKSFAIMVERCPNGLGVPDGRHRLVVPGANGHDANPACILFDLLTDRRFGLGLPETMIDAASFRAAADELYAEGLGMSLVLDDVAEGLDVIQNVMRHVDGVLFTNPATGLLTIDLVRGDYDVATLPRVTPARGATLRMERPAWTAVKNVVKVRFVDRTLGHTPRVLQIQNLASIQALGRLEVEEIEFNGFSHEPPARLAGQRLLRAHGAPLASFEIVDDRSAYSFRPGSVFVLDWPAYGIAGLVARVASIETGSLQDNRIAYNAVEDPDGIGLATFSAFD